MHLPSLLLTLALLAPASASAGPLRGVTPCDLRRIAKIYGSQATARRVLHKVARGSKVVDTPNGPMRDSVYYEVEGAKKIPVSCTFAEAGYDYADSVLLARIWSTDAGSAKGKAEDLIAYGGQWEVDYALEEARYATPPTPEDAALEAFLVGDLYTACDARLLAAHWQTDMTTAKVAIGEKIRARQFDALDGVLSPARYGAMARGETCGFGETGYSLQDAERLAATWRTTVSAAKVRVGDMVIRGQNAALRRMLGDGG